MNPISKKAFFSYKGMQMVAAKDCDVLVSNWRKGTRGTIPEKAFSLTQNGENKGS